MNQTDATIKDNMTAEDTYNLSIFLLLTMNKGKSKIRGRKVVITFDIRHRVKLTNNNPEYNNILFFFSDSNIFIARKNVIIASAITGTSSCPSRDCAFQINEAESRTDGYRAFFFERILWEISNVMKITITEHIAENNLTAKALLPRIAIEAAIIQITNGGYDDEYKPPAEY
jgi:hypothetical protein